DSTLQVALPRVELALVQVLLRPLAELRVRSRGDPMQRPVGRKERKLAFEEGGGLTRAAGLEQSLRIVVDQLHLVRIARERAFEPRDRTVEIAPFHVDVTGHRV